MPIHNREVAITGIPEETGKYIAFLEGNIARLLNTIGDKGTCKGCGATIWWVHHPKTGKGAPYTERGLNHFGDCPNAQNFRKDKPNATPPQSP